MHRTIIAFIAGFVILGGTAMATEEIKYSVVEEVGEIQIRQYEEAVAAEVTIEDERREAINTAFRILFDYIQGNNIASREIPMTAPVSQAKNAQEIPMTAPVSQTQAGAGKWNIAFYMPADMSYEKTPEPLDDRITIRKMAPKRMAAITFSGRGSDANMQEHEQELRDYLTSNNIAFEEPALYAFYDSPFVLWFLRRNEVLFTLSNSN